MHKESNEQVARGNGDLLEKEIIRGKVDGRFGRVRKGGCVKKEYRGYTIYPSIYL